MQHLKDWTISGSLRATTAALNTANQHQVGGVQFGTNGDGDTLIFLSNYFATFSVINASNPFLYAFSASAKIWTGAQNYVAPVLGMAANYYSPADVAFSRLAAGSAALGNGSSGDASGSLTLNTLTATNATVSTVPSAPTDVVNKSYVDTIISGLSLKKEVEAITTAALPANTYNNGTAGVGATLTGSATGVLTVDGYTVGLGDRVMVKNEATAANNGIYVCTTAGAVGVAYVLTRATDNDTSVEIRGSYSNALNGTVNFNTAWANNNTGSITVGTTSLTYAQLFGAGTYSADGSSLSLSGSVFSIANNGVTNGKLAQVSTAIFKGRVTAGTGNVEDLTGAQATSLLNVFTSSLQGLAPASGGGTTNFLRADGTWTVPPATSEYVDLGLRAIYHVQSGGAAVPVAVGDVAPTATGTGTATTVATTNTYTATRVTEYLVTAASTSAVAGWRSTAAKFFLSSSAVRGGFNLVCRFGPATGVATTTNRCFVGMSSNTSAPTDVEPSSLTNMIGVGWDAADTNIQIMRNDGSGTATKIDLGSNFPVPTDDRTKIYELRLDVAPNSTTVNYRFVDVDNPAQAVTGNFSTDIPAANTLLAPRGYMSVGGTSSVIGIALAILTIQG